MLHPSTAAFWLRLAGFLAAGGVAPTHVSAAPAAESTAPKYQFDVPAGDARPMLRQFATQAKREIMFPVDNVTGVSTRALKGEFTLQEGLDQMLADTGLVASLDAKTGAIAVRKASGAASKNVSRAARVASVDRPGLARNVAADTALPPAEGGTTVQLSAFEVTTNQDRGYRSVFSAGGTLVAEELRNVPSSISVLNRELIDDIGATSAFEISRYAAGGEWNQNPTNDTQFSFRGLINEWQTRNFFIWYLPTDAFSIERTEILRGPNALLYGDAQPGGLMNIITKRAQARNFGAVRATVGSWDRYRAELDVNRALNDRLSVRVNGVASRAKDFRDFRYNDFDGVQLAATYRPFKHTQLRAEAERGRVRRNNGTIMLNDQFSSFDPATSATAGTSVRTGDANNYFMSLDGRTLQRHDAAGWRRSNGTTLVLDQTTPLMNVVPREWQFAGPSQHMHRDYNQWSVALEQTLFEKLTLDATVNQQDNHNHWLRGDNNAIELRRDAQATLPDGRPNPRYGELFVDNRFSAQEIQNHVRDYRLAATYRFALPLGIEQRLLAFWTRREDDFEARSYRERAVGNLAVDVYRRTYLADYPKRDLSWAVIPGATRMFATGFWGTNINQLTARSVVALGSYWDGRIRSMVGYRRDRWDVDRWATTSQMLAPGIVEAVGFSPNRTQDAAIKDDSLSYGAVVHAWRSRHGVSVSLVANYSESFRPTGNEFDVFGKPIQPIKGEGREGGVRLEAFDGKATLTGTWFDIDVVNQRAAVSQAVRDEINTLFGAGLVGTGIGSAGDTIQAKSKGYEFELTLNPLPGWSLTANYSHADLSQQDVFPRVRPFWERAQAENRPVAEYAQLNTTVSNAVRQAAWVVPERDKSINLFTRYTINRGALKGFYFGGGLNYRGEAYLGVVSGQFYFSPDSLLLNGLIGYGTRLYNRAVGVALNVNNVTDEETYTAYSFNAAQWSAPREFRLTTTVKF